MKERILTKEIAEQFVAGKIDSLDEFTSIEYDAADVLIKTLNLNSSNNLSHSSLAEARKWGENYFEDAKRSTISLNGVNTVTENILKCLLSFKGSLLELDGLTEIPEASKDLWPTSRFSKSLSLNGLDSLDDRTAKALSSWGGRYLALNGLSSITESAAKALASSKLEQLSLDGLAQISDANAKYLASAKYDLSLGGISVLSENAAAAFAKSKNSIYFNGLTSITENVAKALMPFRGPILRLNGLKTLSTEVAKCLASGKWQHLELNGLFSITEDAAIALAAFKGHLELNGLTSLPESAAKALIPFRGPTLCLSGLNILSTEVAKCLASGKWQHLELNGMSSITEEAAKVLSAFKGITLELNGLTSLSENIAKALAAFKGEQLSFKGLKAFSVNVAKAMSTYKGKHGFLCLDGLNSLPDELAAAFATYSNMAISFEGLSTISDATAKTIARLQCSTICLDGLTSISDSALQALLSFKGKSLSLNRLVNVSASAVKRLATYNGKIDISINKLRSLPETSPAFDIESEEMHDCDVAESDQEDNATVDSQNPLIDALAEGNITEAERLRAGGARIYEDAETLNGFFASLWEEHSLRMFSRPVNPDILPRIVPLEEVINACGPIYESGGACLSLSQRPSGWASAVKAQRVLSWHDSGFGFLGDQTVDINMRLVSAKPLTAFADAIIAGPLPEHGFPEMPAGFIQDKQTSRERRNLPTREEAHRLFYNLVVCQMDLDWTKDLAQYQCLRQPALQLLAEEGQKLSSGNDARMEFSLFGDIGDRKKSLKNLAAADPSVAGLTILLLLAVECVSALEDRKMTSAILKRHAKTKPVTKWEVALWNISLLCLHVADGKVVDVADVEAFLPFLRNPDEPALSIQIERTCSALSGHIAAQYLENHDSMDSALVHRMCKCGWRPPAGFILKCAIDAEDSALLKYLLSCGMYPKGHPGGGINLVPLAAAAMRGNKDAVKLLLDAGADPLEPSHYGGASTLQQARWNCANLEVGEKEKACLKLLEKAVRNDPRVAWLAPAQDDSE